MDDSSMTRFLKPALGGLCAARTEHAEPTRELARLGDVALVDGCFCFATKLLIISDIAAILCHKNRNSC